MSEKIYTRRRLLNLQLKDIPSIYKYELALYVEPNKVNYWIELYIYIYILLYTLSMKINEYAPFLINALDTIVRVVNMLTK